MPHYGKKHTPQPSPSSLLDTLNPTPTNFDDITLQPTPSAFTLQPTPSAFTLNPTPSTFGDTRNPTPANFIVPTASPTYDNSWTLSDTFLVVGVIFGLALILVLFLVYVSPPHTPAKANPPASRENDPLLQSERNRERNSESNL